MHSPCRWFGIAIALSLLVPFGVWSADGVTITLSVATVKQDDSPVHILGFRMPKAGDTPAIVVRNVTSREIRNIGFMNYLGNPRGVESASPQRGSCLGVKGVHERPRRGLAPNASAEFPEASLKPEDVGLEAHFWESNCLHAAFYIASVEFADGTVWRWDGSGDFEAFREQLLQQWKDSIRPESMAGCSNSSTTMETLNRLEGITWNPRAKASNLSANPIPFFIISCSIRDDNVAWCQF
jgi:hypothetical protein